MNNQLSDLDAVVYFHSGEKVIKVPRDGFEDEEFRKVFSSQSIYCSNFNSTPISIYSQLNGEFKQLLLLNSNNLLIIMNKSMILLDLQDHKNNEAIVKKELKYDENDDEIEMIRSTISDGIFYSNEYLNSVDSILIVVGFKKSKILRIYSFDNQQNKSEISLLTQIDSINWDYYGWLKTHPHSYTWQESCIIESTFMIDQTKSNKNNEILLRFCLQEKPDKIKIIEIRNDGKYEIIKEINDETIGIKQEDKFYESHVSNKLYQIELEGYIQNRIILKSKSNRIK